MSYSQNMEDVLLIRVFEKKKDGFYIDIGAHDPSELSVTKLLYQWFDWRGINVDPIPSCIEKFQQERPDETNLNVGVSDTPGNAPFYAVKGTLRSGISASALSSFSKDIVLDACRSLNLGYEVIDVPVVTLADICRQHVPASKQIDLLKIDAEGHEKKIILGGDFDRYRPSVVMLETAEPNMNPFEHWHEKWNINDEIDPIMASRGYEPVYFDGINRFYLAREAEAMRSLFSLPVGVYDGISLPKIYRRISKLCRRVKELEDRLGIPHEEI